MGSRHCARMRWDIPECLPGTFSAHRLGVARASRGLTIRMLAEQSEISAERITAIEAGTSLPTIEELFRLTRPMSYPLGFYLSGHEEMHGDGWICGSGVAPCAICEESAVALCDWPTGRRGTCSLPLCRAHAKPGPEEGMDYCPSHAQLVATGEGL